MGSAIVRVVRALINVSGTRQLVRGMLKADMLANFVVLDRDLTTIEVNDVPDTRVLRTAVGGHSVFEPGQ